MSSLQERTDSSRAQDYLRFIPAEDRDTWLRVGMALKSEFGDEAYSIYDEWSQSANNYDPKAVQAVWRSFNGRGVSFGSIVHLAKQNGWHTQREKRFFSSDTTMYAKQIWVGSSWGDDQVGSHPYSKAKGIGWAAGARRGIASGRIIGQNADCVIVPVRSVSSDKLQGVQCINREGCKQTFGRLSGGSLMLGNSLIKSDPWYVTEGWASAVSTVFHHNRTVAVCAFGKGNLDRVAREIADVYSPDEIIVLEEVDT